MANEKNLIRLSSDEARENGRKGGQKSGEVRRQRKAMREQMELLLSLPVVNQEHRTIMEQLGIDPDNMDNQMLLTMAMYQKAAKGDIEAFKLIQNIVEPQSKGVSPYSEIEDTSEVDEVIYVEDD